MCIRDRQTLLLEDKQSRNFKCLNKRGFYEIIIAKQNMARLTILTPKELQSIYGLPQFTDDEKGLYFSLDPLEEQIVNEIRTYTAKTFFILQLGYFKANKQFFVFSLQTVADDAAYLLRCLLYTSDAADDLTRVDL